MPSKLSTHVLDLTTGQPAAGMTLQLWRRTTEGAVLLKTVTTNADGRTDAPLLRTEEMATGSFEIVFLVKAYFSRHGVPAGFLDDVPVRFTIDDADRSFHVPLLVTPWSYSTYRGS